MSGGFVERELAVARGLASCRGDDARLDEADAEIAKLRAERNALLEVLELAVESGCAIVFANEDDECGEKGCCGVVSYKPHADDCWVTKARAAIDAAREKK